MPTQDKDTEMAIPSQPRKLARKLMQTDLSAYAMGKAAKEGIKKFTAKLPVEVSDYPADDAESNNARFKGGKVNKDHTRKADYKTGGDENAYESVIKRKLIEKFSKYEPAKKMAVVSTTKPIGHTISDIGPGRKASNVKVVKEAGEPMSPAPATSDNPGFSGDSAMATDNGADNEKTNNSGDEENENVNGVREKLENIAMMSAEMFENLQDDAELEKWVLEKLELAHDFIEAVSKEINDSNGGDDEEDEPEGNQGGKDDNNIAKPSAFKGNGEQSMAKEEYTPPKEGDKIDHLPLANQALIRARWAKEAKEKEAKEDWKKGNGEQSMAKEEVELDEATVPAPNEDDEGYHAHRSLHGKNAVSREDWKKGIRKPKDPVKESSLVKMLVTGEKGVKKIAPKKDEYGNEIKDKNRAKYLAKKAAAAAMNTSPTKKGA